MLAIFGTCHLWQGDGGDRILHIDSDNDVQFDEEFYNYLCKTYGARLREKLFLDELTTTLADSQPEKMATAGRGAGRGSLPRIRR